MYSHFLKKFLKETRYISGCLPVSKEMKQWCSNKCYSPHITLTPPIEVYPPTTNVRKYFASTKILANFQIKSSNYIEGGEADRNHVYIIMSNLLLVIWPCGVIFCYLIISGDGRVLHSVILYYALIIFSSEDCFNFTIL